jgi:hypothetical protein
MTLHSHIYPEASLYPTLSWLFGVVPVLALLSLFVGVIVKNRRAVRNMREAEQALDPEAPLGAGHAIIIGKVQHAQSDDVAVRVEIDQEATEHESSGSYSHAWTETDRRVFVRPFYLLTPQNQRVRIEASKEVFLVDRMDGCIHFNELSRTRIVELVPNEEVIAVGMLSKDFDPESKGGHGYRDLPVGWVMRPGRKPIHLSSEPLAERFERQRKFEKKAAWSLVPVLLGVVLLAGSYNLRLFAGDVSKAEVTSLRTYETEDDEGDITVHEEITSVTPWGKTHIEDVDSMDYVARGHSISIRHYKRSFLQYGDKSSLTFPRGIFTVLLVLMAYLSYFGALEASRAWYRKEVVDSGSGKIDKDTGLERML